MDAFETAYHRATAYRAGVSNQKVPPRRSYHQMRASFAAPLPEAGSPDSTVIQELADLGEPGLMHTTHPRFFGWVLGGSAPVAACLNPDDADIIVFRKCQSVPGLDRRATFCRRYSVDAHGP